MTKSAGGAATAGGMDFQHRVAAWIAAHILAENKAVPLWNLRTSTTLEWIRCETEQPVDDILVGTSAGGLIFAQVKRAIVLSESPESELASVLDQFVRQYVYSQRRAPGSHPWDRPLDGTRDRLVLITSSRSSEPIRVHLPALLRRLQDLQDEDTVNSLARNNHELRTISTVRGHLARAWEQVTRELPNDDELRELMTLIRVQVLDVEEDADGEREAKSLLRMAVLEDPSEDKTAWAHLVTHCARLAAERSGASRVDFESALLRAGTKLLAPPSYQGDIERLKQYSERTYRALAESAQIRLDTTAIRIERPATEALRLAAEDGSVLVVGEPGAGKSGVLHSLVQALRNNKRDYVLLAVNRLNARNPGELRMHLGLDHDLVEVLASWPGSSPAFLIIDALDAARGEPSSTLIQDLMREVVREKGRWHVVASIRKFDLRYGAEVRELFAGAPPTVFRDPEFGSVRHVNIPKLSQEELAQVSSRSPTLEALLVGASSELHDLLEVPFNLRLAAEMLGSGASVNEIEPAKTQLDLLDRFWNYRVVRSYGGDGREAILRQVCQEMVQDRSLRVDRSVIAESTVEQNCLEDLLSSQILIEWQASHDIAPERYVLAFSHHVLFDYAVSRLLLRGTQKTAIRRLAADPEILLIARPSFVLHFRHLWSTDSNRRSFWDLVLEIIGLDDIPEVGKLIGPSSAVELARTLVDLEPLYTLIGDFSPKSVLAEQALKHVIGALLAVDPTEHNLVGPSAGPWCQLLERISRVMRRETAYMITPCVSTICEFPEKLTADQKDAIGKAARRLLEFAWSEAAINPWLVRNSLRCVCRTYESNPAASARLIQRCLDPERIREYGYQELPWVAREVQRLVTIDPGLVQDIYLAVFTFQETSTEPTPFGGALLPLVSNRRQDYEMAWYELARVFPAFLEAAAQPAVRALIRAAEFYVEQNHSVRLNQNTEVFGFDGGQARLCTDYSYLWDADDEDRHEEILKMLDAFQAYLEKIAKDPESRNCLSGTINLLVNENRLAVIWRAVLRAAAQAPTSLGSLILPLARSTPILVSPDTSYLAGEFMRSVFPTAGAIERERIEKAILSIPEAVPNRKEAAERTRDRLLGCLPEDLLVTEESKSIVSQLKAAGGIPANKPPLVIGSWTGTEYGEEEHLRDLGVPVDAKENRRIRDLQLPIREFARKHLNSVPTREDSSALLSNLRDLYTAISTAEESGVHPKQQEHAFDSLVAACARLARADWLPQEDTLMSLARSVLIQASSHPEPTPDPESDAHFDEFPSWGSPAPRIEAAQGMIALVRLPGQATVEVLEALKRLVEDPVPAVRFQVARNLNVLYNSNRDLMWLLLRLVAHKEPSTGVLQGFLSGSISRLAGADPDLIADLVKVIFERVRVGPGAKEVRRSCAALFADMHIWRNHEPSSKIAVDIADHSAEYPEEALYMVSRIEHALETGPSYPVNPERDKIWFRALDLGYRVLVSAKDGLRQIEQRRWPADERDTAKALVHLVDSIGMTLYRASGAAESKRHLEGKSRPPKPERSTRFLKEALPLLRELADAGLASVTHSLLQTLEFFIPVDPAEVFVCIGQVVLAGKNAGYQYESLAADLIVKLIGRYLAEYSELLRDNSACRRALVEILDVFVIAGWPSAQRLAYRLEEIFR